MKDKPTGRLKIHHRIGIKAMAALLIGAGKLLLRIKTYEEVEKWLKDMEKQVDELEQIHDFSELDDF